MLNTQAYCEHEKIIHEHLSNDTLDSLVSISVVQDNTVITIYRESKN